MTRRDSCLVSTRAGHLREIAEELDGDNVFMITDGNRVSLEYTVLVEDGTVITTNVGADPFVYVHGSGQVPLALESQLAVLNVQERKEITLLPEEAYGPIDSEAFRKVAAESIPEEARKPGTLLQARESDGSTRVVRVHEVFPEHVVLDFNHELAGKRLTFRVRILQIDT